MPQRTMSTLHFPIDSPSYLLGGCWSYCVCVWRERGKLSSDWREIHKVEMSLSLEERLYLWCGYRHHRPCSWTTNGTQRAYYLLRVCELDGLLFSPGFLWIQGGHRTRKCLKSMYSFSNSNKYVCFWNSFSTISLVTNGKGTLFPFPPVIFSVRSKFKYLSFEEVKYFLLKFKIFYLFLQPNLLHLF